jgi:hypothetical protein
MNTFDDVFSAFGGPSRYAEAIGIDPIHAGTMKTRGSIPPAYWADTVTAAAYLAISEPDDEKRAALKSVTLEALAELAKAKRPPSAEQSNTSAPERAAS